MKHLVYVLDNIDTTTKLGYRVSGSKSTPII